MTESSRLTMAFIGCGNIARAHWRGIRYVADRIDVTAVVDKNEERAKDMARRTGGEAFTSLEEALAHGTFDAVAVTGHHIPNMDGESWTHALIRFANGLTASFDALLSAGATGPTEDFRITGTTGELVIENGRDGHLMLFNDAHPEGKAIMASFPGKVDSYGLELKDFCEHVLDGTPLAATPQYSLGELRTAFAMYRSAQSG